ncbi:MAG: asparagine synthase-related protein, partial [Anaerolineales bacterium]|nr:asparagine synthase-related protein [Anaerolineales bacterium]
MDSPQQASTHFGIHSTCGDLLLLFGEALAPNVSRHHESSWQLKLACQQGKLFEQPSASVWKGFHLQSSSSPDWRFAALGEANLQLFSDNTTENLTRQLISQTGSFLVFGYHKPSQTWHAWTDRFGTLHAYYAWEGQRAALGTFSPAVAAAASQRKLDWEALAGWFAFGFFPADRTHYTDVRILRPASHYTFDQAGRLLRQERYWQWQHDPDEKRPYEDTVSAFGEVFGAVMSDALAQGRVALPLSGGLDSRSTLAAVTPSLASSGRVWGYSYGYHRRSVETRIARQLAAARRLPFQEFVIQPYLFDKIESLLAYTEGFQDLTQARQMCVCDEIAAHADALVAALWGDVWLDEMGLSGQPGAEADQVLQHALAKVHKPGGWLLQQLALPQLHQGSAQELLKAFVSSELQPLSHLPEPDFRVKAYKTEQWSFRWSIPPTRVFQSAAWPRKIFYDTRLADFFATVPSAYLSGRSLQIDYLKRFAPDLARVPWQVYDADLFHYQHFNTWLIPKRVVKKGWRMLTRQKVLERNWEVQFLSPGGRAGLAHWLLRPGIKLHAFVSPGEVNKLLDAFFAAPLPSGLAYSVSMLLTFSAW